MCSALLLQAAAGHLMLHHAVLRCAVQVLFHLQACRPAVLPPLWQLFFSEPHMGARPLEQEPSQQQPAADSISTSTSSRSRSASNPRQQSSTMAGAPYHLLDVCAAQRQRIQPLYNSSSRESSNKPLLLLAGFFVRYREVLWQWCQLRQHR
jgi:hypothetical protein